MTDDYLADFERELHAAARRRTAPARRRWLAPAFAAAAAAAVTLVLVLASPAEREVEVPAGPPPSGQIDLPALAPSSCDPRERDLDVEDYPLSIFRRTQHPPDALWGDVIRFDAADYDPRATRSPTGIGQLVVLSPTSDVGCGGGGGRGVCLVDGRDSRCFTLEQIAAGRAVVLMEPRAAVGIVPDGFESVAIEAGGKRRTTAVVENAFRVELPSEASSVHVELIAKAHDGCAPPAAMRRAVPVLDREPVNGGVPPAIRNSFDRDSPVIGRHARIWGGGDGITYWVFPWLRCDGAAEDAVCVAPLHQDDMNGRDGGGAACGTLDRLERTWIHFPLRGRGAGVVGFAPSGVAAVEVSDPLRNFEQRFEVEDGVWGGTLEGDAPPREPGTIEVAFETAG